MKAYCDIILLVKLWNCMKILHKKNETILLIVNFCGEFCDKLRITLI